MELKTLPQTKLGWICWIICLILAGIAGWYVPDDFFKFSCFAIGSFIFLLLGMLTDVG